MAMWTSGIVSASCRFDVEDPETFTFELIAFELVVEVCSIVLDKHYIVVNKVYEVLVLSVVAASLRNVIL